METLSVVEIIQSVISLFFSDDLLLFGEVSMRRTRYIQKILNDLCMASGQKVNLNKSKVWYTPNTAREMMCSD